MARRTLNKNNIFQFKLSIFDFLDFNLKYYVDFIIV